MSKRKMPKLKSGSSSTAPKPDFTYSDEEDVSRPAPRERGKGTKVDPTFKKLKKLFGQ